MAETTPSTTPAHATSTFHFVRHFGEMVAAMMIGMMVCGAVFSAAVGIPVDDALRRYPVWFMLAMAFSMSAPMIAWMRFRGHPLQRCTEMAAAMWAPVIPLAALRLSDAVTGAVCGFYCLASTAAMVLVMLYRRHDYAGAHVR
jgi:flagellar biosynthetic protein FliP